MVKYPVHSKFAALADPNRTEIIDRLSMGEASVSELARPLRLSLPAITKHLRVLDELGLIETRKEGRTRICVLRPEGLDEAFEWLADRRRLWESRMDSLESHLKRRDG